MLLKVKKLSKHYGGVAALKDVSFTVAAGTVTALVGGNGAGKSTLMKCITGAESADAGEVLFNNMPLFLGSPRAVREAGIEMVYQDLQLCWQRTVTENIYLGREERLSFFGMPTPFLNKARMRRNVQKFLQRINAAVPVDVEAGTLSGGQQQAVAIARALLAKPKLLILDEPMAALGLAEVKKVIGLVQALKKSGIAVIIISHRMEDVLKIADQVVLLQHGQIKGIKAATQKSLKRRIKKN